MDWSQVPADRIRDERQLRENIDDMRQEKDRGRVILSEQYREPSSIVHCGAYATIYRKLV